MAKAKEAFLKKHLEEQIPKCDYNVRIGPKRSAKKNSSDLRLTEEGRSVFQGGGPAVKKLLERMIEERDRIFTAGLTNDNGVVFSLDLLEWDRTFSGFGRSEN